MLDFRSMGKLEYMTKYRIDKDTKIIKSFIAIIDNIDNNFFKICISVFLDDKRKNKVSVYNNLIVFKDKRGIQHKFSFDSFYVMRLDHYIEHIKRTYKTKVEKETVKLDFYQHHWYNSTIKTENEYQVNLGSIKTGKNSESSIDVMITVDKKNGVICREKDAFVKPITIVNGETKFDSSSVEIFTLGNTGVVHFVDKEIYHSYYDKHGDQHSLVFSGLDIIINGPLHNIPAFYQNHKIVNIDDKETIEIDYDVYGIYKSNNSESKYPVMYEEIYSGKDISGYPAIVYSLHPIHIDHNNLSLTHSDSLYALDNYDSVFEANSNEYIFTRETRRFEQKDIDKINYEITNNRNSLLVPSIDDLIYEVLYGNN
mgnify:CR=1 FL=1